MTNSGRGTEKRERLVAAAADLLYNKGVQRTTLNDVSAVADVPLGNVYYYFKTRDELVHAVIGQREAEIRAALALLDQRRTPKARLKGLTDLWTGSADLVVSSGCPLGGLMYELNKGHDELAAHAQSLLAMLVDWSEAQFRELGRRDARALAVQFVGGIQGAALLANTFGDATLLAAEVRRLQRWVESLT